MKIKSITLSLAAIITIGLVACNSQNGSTTKITKPTSLNDSIALEVGHHYGQAIAQQFPDVDSKLVIQGILAGMNGEDDPVYATPEEANVAIRGYLTSISERKAKEAQEAGEAFLAENAKKEGIKVTESGLQYEVIQEGTGAKPTTENTVSVTYEGRTIDGEIFDSSIERGDTATFPVTGVIKGWTEGLQLMSVGSKYKFYIPSDLAYGPRGAGQKIGPNSTLIFDVELIDIK